MPPLEVRPSSVAPDPAESRGAPPPPQDPSPLRGTLGSSLRSPAEGEGRTPPIPRSALEKDPRPGPLFEGNPVGEGTKRRGTDTPMHLLETPAGSTLPALQVDSLPAEPQGKPKNTGVGSLSLLQWIFQTQESNQGLPRCRLILYHLSHQGSPRILEWVAYPFSMEIGRAHV